MMHKAIKGNQVDSIHHSRINALPAYRPIGTKERNMTEDNKGTPEFKPLSEWMPLVDGERFESRSGGQFHIDGDEVVSIGGGSFKIALSLRLYTPLDRDTPSEVDCSNPDKLSIYDAPKEMRSEFIEAILSGDPVELYDGSAWSPLDPSQLLNMNVDSLFRLVCRVSEETPITVDWSQVHNDIKFIAADEFGVLWGFENRPYAYVGLSGSWVSECKDDPRYLQGIVSSLDRGTIAWDKSLIERPTGDNP